MSTITSVNFAPTDGLGRLRQTHTAVLAQYLLLTYAVVLLNISSLLREVQYVGWVTVPFVAAVYLTYSFIYLLPVFLPLFALDQLLALAAFDGVLGKSAVSRRWIVCIAAVVGTSLLQILIFADKFIFKLYGFHLNGFVWNLVRTPGGIDSLGGGGSTTLSFTLIILAFIFVQAGLLVAIIRFEWLRGRLSRWLPRRRLAILVGLLIGAGGLERLANGVANLHGYRPVLMASSVFPLYLPTTLTGIARSLGYEGRSRSSMKLDVDSLRLRYPREPIRRATLEHPPNIVWLVAESLRADMVDPEIMPATWAVAHKADWFRQHYSGGNGTRMGMFSMFYGLYGCSWFSFLEAHRGPVLMDVLLDAGYQMKMFTSQSFTYPELDKTIFVRIDPSLLQEGQGQPPWRRDRENIADLLNFIDRRDAARPFMTFMFFESTHAKYFFPQDTIIRRPYLEDLNYATMDLQGDIALMKNRYINACNHVDTQIQRVVDHLAQNKLLESTIVLVTGDHGEEFMEKGRWGHNSAFTEEQTRVPFVLWVPGRPPHEVTRMTSHLDIPATLMPLLGVENPPEDYSLGYDLLSGKERDYVVISDWNSAAYVDSRFKAVFPLKVRGVADQKTTTKDDVLVAESAAFYENTKQRLVQIMRDMKAFSR